MYGQLTRVSRSKSWFYQFPLYVVHIFVIHMYGTYIWVSVLINTHVEGGQINKSDVFSISTLLPWKKESLIVSSPSLCCPSVPVPLSLEAGLVGQQALHSQCWLGLQAHTTKPDFYVGGPNSGVHACRLSTLIHWAISLAPSLFFEIRFAM